MDDTYSLDAELLLRLNEGDRDAFSFVFERYYRMLYALAFKYLKSEDAAMDAVQNTCMKLWEMSGTLTFDTKLKGLLFTILKNDILNTIRNDKRHIARLYMMAQEAEKPVPDLLNTDHDDENLYRRLHEAIEKLPSQQRTICLIKLNEKLTNMEIAAKLNIALSTVKTHYSKALKSLRTMLNEENLMILIVLFVTLGVIYGR